MNQPQAAFGTVMEPPITLYRIALINPNTSTQATALMLASARQALPSGFSVEGRKPPVASH
jgi:hypothetical protein